MKVEDVKELNDDIGEYVENELIPMADSVLDSISGFVLGNLVKKYNMNLSEALRCCDEILMDYIAGIILAWRYVINTSLMEVSKK